MKKFLLLVTAFSFTIAHSQINVQWETRYTSAGANTDRVADMVVDAAGNVYVTGSAYSAASGYDIVTRKYDNTGAILWTQVFNGTGNGLDYAYDLAVASNGNVVISGYSLVAGTNYDFVVIQYTNAGALDWQIYNGGTNFDEARAVTIDSNNDVIVVGGFQASATNTNYRTLKLSGINGATIWTQDFSSAGNNLDMAIDVVLDASNAVYVTGQSFNTGQDLNVRTLKYNSTGGAPVWNTQYNHNATLNSYDTPSDLVIDASGNVYVVATVYQGAATDDDILLIRYNTTGTITNTVVYNGTANDKDKPNEIIIDGTGNLYICGSAKNTATAEDFLVAKYDNNLGFLWAKNYNGIGANYDEAFDVVFDVTGTYIYATGYSYLPTSNNDYFTIKYEATNGNVIWTTRFNGSANNTDQAKVLDVDGAGNVYVSGDSRGSGSNFDYSTIKYCQLTTNAGSDTSVCAGSAVPFTATGGTSFTWSPTTYLTCSNCSTPTANNPVSDISYIVSSTDGNGCTDLDTVSITINPLPGPVITPSGPTSFCMGGSVDLTASGFSSYNWSTFETTPTITVNSTGTYSVTVTDGMGCQNTTNIGVTVFTLPTVDAGISNPICNGDTTQLLASGGLTYMWEVNPALDSINWANPFVNPNTSQYFTVVGTDANGCTGTDSVFVTVNSLPAAPSLIRQFNGDLLVITNYSTGLTWFQNGNLMSGVSGNTYDMGDTLNTYACEFNAEYWAVFTDINGCVSPHSDTIFVDTFFVSPECYLFIPEKANIASHINVYPNPSDGDFYLEIIDLPSMNFSAEVFDVSGRLLYVMQPETIAGSQRKLIPMHHAVNGLYMLRVRLNESVISLRLIKN